MSDDRGGFTPQITRTNSVFPQSGPLAGSTQVGPMYRGDVTYIRYPGGVAGSASRKWQELIPRGYELVRRDAGGVYVRPKRSSAATDYPVAGPTVAGHERYVADQRLRENEQLARNRQAQADYEATVRDSAAHRVTVDGVLVDPNDTTTGPAGGLIRADDQGNISTLGQDGKRIPSTVSYEARAAAAQTAAVNVFNVLNLQDIDASAQYVASYGAPVVDPTDPLSSRAAPSQNQDLKVGGRNASQRTDAERYGNQQNMMTITQGVNWFRNLSVKDPGAYNELIVKLWHANYLSGSGPEDLPLNGFTAVAAQQFATALFDLAQANAAGDQRSLPDWLNARGQAAAEADANGGADAYKPVDRQFTDPAALRAQAKSAAEAALGRALTDDEEARLVGRFHSLEAGMYDQIDAAGRAGTSATVTPPNPTGQVDQFLESGPLEQEQANFHVAQYGEALRSLFGLHG